MSVRLAPFPPVEENIHGIAVDDPFRWLEDRGLPETELWIEQQKLRSAIYFSDCDALAILRKRVREFLNAEVVDQPARVGRRYFYRRRNQGQEQACIYVRDSETDEERLLVDPSGAGAFTSVGIHRVSEDASLLAYEVKRGGSDTREIRFIDVASGRLLSCQIDEGYLRGFVFASDNQGFYYCLESSCDDHHFIRFQSFFSSESRIVFHRSRTPGSRLLLTGNGAHLGAMWIHEEGAERVCDFFVARGELDTEWRSVFTNRRLPYTPICHRDRLFVLSFENAPNGKIIELSADGELIQTVVPEGVARVRHFLIAGERIVVDYLVDGTSSIRSWTLDGAFDGEPGLPVGGSIQVLTQFNPESDSFFYSHESFTTSRKIYEYESPSGRTLVWDGKPAPGSDRRHEVRRSSFQAKDGTRIPLSLIAQDKIDQIGPRPVVMTSYGGFGAAMTPQFSVFVTIMLDLGVLFAIAHVRGGGEFGRNWHDAGRARNKQTAVDDFTSAAEWLCSEGITSPSQLAIFGGSNSGLLVGAAMTQRPDLFRAVICIAPLLDMVRYERFDNAGRWKTEYGSVRDPDDFRALLAYSPYHNVRESVNYPATLFFTGDRDERCNPAHVRKMAARLQGRAEQDRPVLVEYSAERGHSPTLPLSVRIEALARRLAFVVRELGLEIPLEVSHETSSC
jgi:prolyl oligopeptidase